jgi:hypothetical protein
MNFTRIGCSFLLACALILSARGQNRFEPDLAALAREGTSVYNRTASPLDDSTREGVHLDARPGDGVAWIPDLTLDDGRIEVDLRGRNQPGQSFVGIAFHGADDQTFEGVYLRPFNFQSDDPERRAHSVQYISMPAYTWDRLREEDPGRYEAALDPAPDPEAWVHLSVEVTGSSVRVYVNDGAEPALVVERLGDLGRGKVGLWVGHNAEGDFSNLRITPP